MKQKLSTTQVARQLGIARITLLRSLQSDLLAEPEVIDIGGHKVRPWIHNNAQWALTLTKKYTQCHGPLQNTTWGQV